ncbi:MULTISPECIES: hypothetical protein [Gordonia]|uniref:Holin n=1 Tax=Gordonia amicalis TaxID=89053 RepID=A0ABU4DK47_9ACTN|nr:MULTISPECIES: hypothetical protein [Gordonia]ATD72746.1 hypothetical protein CNO18_23240 [Gordonia sp. 1D]MCR8899395.1 hypothetical protein [Gordonia sp. GONU]MCZ0915376.1 hypothetical protein [Gordonia amicalis]MCZ4581805.1 hypothetical protein [Gordonia amicalis]MDJ0454371.1 hypothetical protein [Gordonia amicalis]
MTSPEPYRQPNPGAAPGNSAPPIATPNPVGFRRNVETKASTKTSELIAYGLAVLAVVITALVVGGGDGDVDPFGAADALKYITWLTVGYMIARGLAKSGSPEPQDDAGGY